MVGCQLALLHCSPLLFAPVAVNDMALNPRLRLYEALSQFPHMSTNSTRRPKTAEVVTCLRKLVPKLFWTLIHLLVVIAMIQNPEQHSVFVRLPPSRLPGCKTSCGEGKTIIVRLSQFQLDITRGQLL